MNYSNCSETVLTLQSVCIWGFTSFVFFFGSKEEELKEFTGTFLVAYSFLFSSRGF